MMQVVIRGDGVSAYCCAHLLGKAGFGVMLERVSRPQLPVILLGNQALALVRDIFDLTGPLRGALRVSRRVVAWGPQAKPLSLKHSALAVPEELLLQGIRPELAAGHNPSSAGWKVFAARPLPAPALEHAFGSRMASVATVELRQQADSAACVMESLNDGWLFLIPGPSRLGWLLAAGASPEHLLGQSRVIAAALSRHNPPCGEFPAYPRIASPLGGSDWLACGTAAMTFDPICGDGTAHAIREAVLATAVLRALDKGDSTEALVAHYEARLTAGFCRHLALCRAFYSSGGTSPFWTAELEAIDRGIQWCNAKLGARPEFRYQLRGFELEAVR
jgi:hypothetical protein